MKYLQTVTDEGFARDLIDWAEYLDTLDSQTTISRPVSLYADSVFGNEPTKIELYPSESGIWFVRTDLLGNYDLSDLDGIDPEYKIELRFENLRVKPRRVALTNGYIDIDGPTEHIAAALRYGAKIDNVTVGIDKEFFPFFENGVLEILVNLYRVGINNLRKPREGVYFNHENAFPFCDENDPQRRISMEKSDGLFIDCSVDFMAEVPVVGKQTFRDEVSSRMFLKELSEARSLTTPEWMKELRGKYPENKVSDNCFIIAGGNKYLNDPRYLDGASNTEICRHNFLDILGVMAPEGHVFGKIKSERAGHSMVYEFLKQLRERGMLERRECRQQ